MWAHRLTTQPPQPPPAPAALPKANVLHCGDIAPAQERVQNPQPQRAEQSPHDGNYTCRGAPGNLYRLTSEAPGRALTGAFPPEFVSHAASQIRALRLSILPKQPSLGSLTQAIRTYKS